MPEKRNILVTGGAGYIGSILVPMLLTDNNDVMVIDNFMYQQNSLLDCCHDKRLTIIRGDARDKKLILAHLGKADVVIPLACLTGAPLCAKDPWAARGIIIDAVKLITENIGTGQIILYPNTNSGYGTGSRSMVYTEESPLRPISLYGRLKVEAEQRICETANWVNYRLATVFGAATRMRVDLLVNDFVYRAVTDHSLVLFEADAKRNYVHVRDVGAAFVFAIENFERLKGNIYNLGLSDANLSKRELCDAIKEVVHEFHYFVGEIGSDPDKRDYIVSNEKIERAGFKPKISLRDGIEELVKAFRILHLKRQCATNFQ
jgi:nucleoside-diphosphate-sugar epimerase